MLKASRVETIKYTDCDSWDWHKLSDIIHGPSGADSASRS